MKKILLFCSIALSCFSFTYKGNVESVKTTQYNLKLDKETTDKYSVNLKNSFEKGYIVFDENGKVKEKMINFSDIQNNFLASIGQEVNYFINLSQNFSDLINFRSETNFPVFHMTYGEETAGKISEFFFEKNIIIKDSYENNLLKERNIWNDNGGLERKLKYKTINTGNKATTVFVDTYLKAGNLDLSEKFIFNPSNQLIQYTLDKSNDSLQLGDTSKYNYRFKYDKNENLIKLEKLSYNLEDKKIEIVLKYDKNNFLSFMDVTEFSLFGNKEYNVKFLNVLDEKGNLIEKTYTLLEEKFGEKGYVPKFVEKNEIIYY